MNTATAPSLMGAAPPAAAGHTAPQTLLDLMYDGFYALFMLKNGNGPQQNAEFAQKMTQFLDDFGRGARKHGASPDDVDAAKYAFCAAVDEIILRSTFSIRDAWERRPLQLALFGEQLAGENFFHRLEALRARGGAHLQALEVYHMCLLLGFQGRYILEGVEKLSWLTARLGDEIVHLQGKRAPFSPHWAPPDRIAHKLRSEVPLWVMGSVFAVVALVAFIGLRSQLHRNTDADLGRYTDVVKLAPQPAYVTITLP